MRSTLGQLIERMENLSDAQELLKALAELQSLEEPLYDQVSLNLGELVKHAQTIGRIAATNVAASDQCNIIMTIEMSQILNNVTFQVLLAYAMKQGILLNLAEKQAQERASSALLNWTLSPEQQTEAQPNPDQQTPQRDEPPSTSSQSPA